MPHVIIELSKDAVSEDDVSSLMLAVHQSIVATGLFKENNIKVRCYLTEHYMIAGVADSFSHAQLRIKPGRSLLQKKLLSGYVLKTIKKAVSNVSVVTIEIIEMDAESYNKYSQPTVRRND